MPTREEMLELVNAHAALDDPMDTAIWIRKEDQDRAYLVEVIPSMERDDHPERPVVFNPGRQFRYPLHLIGVNRDDLERALGLDLDLARDVAGGEILYGEEVGREIKALAERLVTRGQAQAS